MNLGRLALKKLVLLPSLITLAVTLLRLLGEVMGWSPMLFSPEAGGGASLVGIVWLVPIFGIYFAVKLNRSGQVSASAGRTIGFGFLGLGIVVVTTVFVGLVAKPTDIWALIVISLVSLGAAYIVTKGWRELSLTLFVYGLAARIPVVIVMFLAILGDWGTHYDVVPDPAFPPMNWFLKWVLIGLIPQLTIWVAFTMIVGGVFGGIALALLGRRTTV